MPADSLQMQVEESAEPSPERPAGRVVERDADGQFVRGQSGNPAGREPGSRNRVTQLMEEHFDRFSGALANKAVQLALDGDAAAMRLCVSRILAPRRHRPSDFTMPTLRSAADLAPAMAAIADAVSDGTISPSEAGELAKVVDTFMRALEAGETETRLQQLERVNGLVR